MSADPRRELLLATLSLRLSSVTRDLDAVLETAVDQVDRALGATVAIGLVTEDLRHTRPLACSDDREESEVARLLEEPSGDEQPVAVVPLIAGGDVIGRMAAFRDPGGPPFTDTQRQLLQDLAAPVALALDNAFNYRHLEERVAERTHELEQRGVQLERTNEALDRFATTIAHDLRTPLAAMVGFADLLATHELAEEARHSVTVRLRERAEQASALVQELLQWSRSLAVGSSGHHTDLAVLADWVVRVLTPRIERSGAAVTVTARGDAPVASTPLRHLLLNLVDNALRHGGDRPTVDILGTVSADGWRLAVRDHGPGLAQGAAEGLGLQTCRSLAAQIGATVTTSPTDGGGLTVEVRAER